VGRPAEIPSDSDIGKLGRALAAELPGRRDRDETRTAPVGLCEIASLSQAAVTERAARNLKREWLIPSYAYPARRSGMVAWRIRGLGLRSQ